MNTTDIYGLLSGGIVNDCGYDLTGFGLLGVGPEREPPDMLLDAALQEEAVSGLSHRLSNTADNLADARRQIADLQRRLDDQTQAASACEESRERYPTEATEEMVTAFIGHDSHLKDTRNTVRKRLAAALRAAPQPKPRLGERLVSGLTELAEGLEARTDEPTNANGYRPPYPGLTLPIAGLTQAPLPTRAEILDRINKLWEEGDTSDGICNTIADYVLSLLHQHARPGGGEPECEGCKKLLMQVSELDRQLQDAKAGLVTPPLPTREEIVRGLKAAYRGADGARAWDYLAEADYVLSLLAKHARPAAPVSLRGLVEVMQSHLCVGKHTAWEDAARAAARYCGREVVE